MGSGASAPTASPDAAVLPALAELSAEDKARVLDAANEAIAEAMANIQKEKKWKAASDELKPKLSAKKHAGEKTLLWISDGILSWPVAASAAKEGVMQMWYAAKEQHELWDDIVAAMKAAEVPEGSFTHVGWMFHGSEMTGEYKEQNLKFLAALKPYLAEGARVDILACEMVAGPTGLKIFKELEKESGINLAASTDLTGNSAAGGNWILETDGVDVKEQYFTDAINEFSETLLGFAMHRKAVKAAQRRRGGGFF
ncbi:Herc4 [Symbiodinium sp. CCMP2456]|nr:Herc4 [Symbiodinium sp. CCMP2456]